MMKSPGRSRTELRKVYCNVLEGVTYEDRCLFALSKVIEANPACEECVVREARRLKRTGIEEPEVKPVVKVKIERKKKPKKRPKPARGAPKRTLEHNDIKESEDIKPPDDIKKPEDTKPLDDIAQTLDALSVGKIIGLSKRRTQELAKEGKIPARKVGRYWRFDRTEIEQWLQEGKPAASGIPVKAKLEKPGATPGPNEGEKKCHDVVGTMSPQAIAQDQSAREIEKPAGDPGQTLEGEEPNGAGECISK